MVIHGIFMAPHGTSSNLMGLTAPQHDIFIVIALSLHDTSGSRMAAAYHSSPVAL